MNDNSKKTFEQRMREHRAQYEAQRGSTPQEDVMNAMYNDEKEDDTYQTVMADEPAVEVANANQPMMREDQMEQQPLQQEPPMQQPMRPGQQPMPLGQQVEPVSEAPMFGPGPETWENPLYTAGFLRTQIGKYMRVEFLIGSTLLNDRTGKLVEVGVSYIILESIDGITRTVCDIYSIKFATLLDVSDDMARALL